ALKLMSGVMMLGMGVALVIDPTALQNVSLALGLILGSLGITTLIILGRKLLKAK
ncbi:MAG: cytochrome C biosynthesis protein, partial [Shewanella sp.]